MEALIQFIPLLIFTLLMVVPGWKLVRRVGMSPAWLFFFLLPMMGFLVFLWVIAFAKWGIADADDLRLQKTALQSS